ncbi:MAG: Fe-S cluster assembly protein SufB [Parcubacteria group bacterium]|nr:Fe-S cluster assembly protein SufB [Parcubacteria group bacterium]|tara:strand:- start:6926 stop:8323 length:1398 start_codon:yes stop_codon:yes gene_type:complete
MQTKTININQAKYSFKDPQNYVFKTPKGLNEKVIRQISKQKKEPSWMLDIRLKAFKAFLKKPMPEWGGNLKDIDFDNITYYIKPSDKSATSWNKVPKKIKNTFERLGIPQAERKFLAGVGAQYESEVIYHSLKKRWTKLGVIFADMSEAPKLYPELVKKYFGSSVPYNDNKFAALNTAAWSGGSFIYVPKGVHVEAPLQAYFRINAPSMGQFERTLILVDEGASVHYIEGCTAPTYSKDSLHAAVVELVAMKNSKVRYTTIQNWSSNVYNLVTKRAIAHEGALVEWVDGNLGSKLTMKYPAVILKGEGSKADILSIAFAGDKQHQDTGAKVIHLASNTTSNIVSKSISKDGGRSSYRGLVQVAKQANNCKVKVNCDALLVDKKSRSDTYPLMKINNKKVTVEHEASVSKVNEEQLFYLMSRGLSQEEAERMIVTGFLEIFAKELPLEYAVELNRLIEMEMEGSVG